MVDYWPPIPDYWPRSFHLNTTPTTINSTSSTTITSITYNYVVPYTVVRPHEGVRMPDDPWDWSGAIAQGPDYEFPELEVNARVRVGGNSAGSYTGRIVRRETSRGSRGFINFSVSCDCHERSDPYIIQADVIQLIGAAPQRPADHIEGPCGDQNCLPCYPTFAERRRLVEALRHLLDDDPVDLGQRYDSLLARMRVLQEREARAARERQEVVERAQAPLRARQLLKSLLTPEEGERMERESVFYYTTPAGTVYRIKTSGSISGNIGVVKKDVDVNAIDSFGRLPDNQHCLDVQFCIHITDSGMVPEDNAIAQVLMLSTEEDRFLAMANFASGDLRNRPELGAMRADGYAARIRANYAQAGWTVLHEGRWATPDTVGAEVYKFNDWMVRRYRDFNIQPYAFDRIGPVSPVIIFWRGAMPETEKRELIQKWADGTLPYGGPKMDPYVRRRWRDDGVVGPRRSNIAVLPTNTEGDYAVAG